MVRMTKCNNIYENISQIVFIYLNIFVRVVCILANVIS